MWVRLPLSALAAFVLLCSNALGSTLFLGDSLAVGTAPLIHIPHMRVNARVGRPLAEGMAQLGNYGHIDRLMVSLFSNDDPSHARDLRRAVRFTLRRATCVVWATIRVRSLDYGRANRWLLRHRSKRLKVVDWAGTVRRHPSLLGGDQVHPTSHGYYVRSRMYVKAIHQC